MTNPPIPQGQQPLSVSPERYNYLRSQAANIYARTGSPDSVRQFLALETRRSNSGPVHDPVELADPDAPSYLRGLSMAMLQGATFGFGDEGLGALYGSMTGIGARAGIDEYRREYQAWAEQNGKSAFVGEIVGGLVTGGVGGIAGKGFLRMLARAGASAAVAGAGNAEGDIGERTKAAFLGGALGVAGGAAFGAAGAVLRPVTRPLAQRIVPEPILKLVGLTPESRMRELLARTLQSEGLDPLEIEKRAMALQRAGIPATIIEVGGDAIRRLTADAVSQRSPLKTRLVEDLLVRQAQQGERLSAQFLARAVSRNRFGMANAYEVEDKLRQAALGDSDALYREAFQQVVEVTPRMQRLLRHPKLREAYQEGARLARDADLAGTEHGLPVQALPGRNKQLRALLAQGVPRDKAVAAVGDDTFPTQLPVRGIDNMKRGLDIIVRRGLSNQNSTLDRQGAKALYNLLGEVTTEATEQVGSYGRALAAYSGNITSKHAVETGRELFRKTPHAIAKELEKLSPNDRDFYRLGATQALYERVMKANERSGTPKDVAAMFGGHLFERRTMAADRIRALFPDAPHVADDFMRVAMGEATISYTTRRAISLPRNLSVDKVEQAVEGSVPSVRGTLGVTLASAARQAVVRTRTKLSQEESDELTQLLSKGLTDPNELRSLVASLYHTYGQLDTRGRVRTHVTTSLGQVGGRVAASQTQ